MPILCTNDLTAGYRKGKDKHVIMSGLNIVLRRGVLAALVGANGIGKSTLLRTITGTQSPLDGYIEIAGLPIEKLNASQLARLLAIVNTDRTQAGGLTVRELVSLGRQPYTGFLGILDKYDRETVEKSMENTGIAHKAECFVAELSDGERQKAMIAKALAQCTPIIVLDEPTAFLDVESRMEIMLLLHRLAHEENKAVLLSSHDLSQSMLLADELWVVTHDRKLLYGNTEDVVLSGAMNDIFTSENIGFDLLQGDFCINMDTRHSVRLVCHNDIRRRWITNALKRNSIGISDDDKNEITVEDNTPDGISIFTPHKHYPAKNISALITILQKSILNK